MWTLDYVGLRALGHLDCLPAADVGLQKVIQRLYRLRKPPTPLRVEKVGKAWRGWRSYATFYLWLTYWEEAEWRQAALEAPVGAPEVAIPARLTGSCDSQPEDQ